MPNTERTVLVIDDEANIREFLRFVLEKNGYVVLEASDGGEGLRVFENNHVDVIITDLIMPEQEGIETIIRLKASRQDLKIIAMSGAINSDTYLTIAAGLGAHSTLRKPFNSKQVIDAIRLALAA